MPKKEPLGDDALGFEFRRPRLLPKATTDRVLARLTGKPVTGKEGESAGDLVDVQMHKSDVKFWIAYCGMRQREQVAERDLKNLDGSEEEVAMQTDVLTSKLECCGFGFSAGNAGVLPKAHTLLGAVEPAMTWEEVDRQMKAAMFVASAEGGLFDDEELLAEFLKLEQAKDGEWVQALAAFRELRGERRARKRAAAAVEQAEQSPSVLRSVFRAVGAAGRVMVSPLTGRTAREPAAVPPARRSLLPDLVAAHREQAGATGLAAAAPAAAADPAAAAAPGGVAPG